jgi:lipoprotein-releasing system permease protein
MILALLLIGILVFIFGVILIIFNVFSTISIFSVFLGTSTMVVVLSVLGGLEGEQKNQILDFSPHIIIAGHNHENIAHQGKVKKQIKNLLQQNNLEYSMSPYLEEEVLLKSISFEATQGIILRGIDPQSPSFDLEGHLKNGTILNLSNENILKWVDPTVLSIAISGQHDLFSFLPRWPGNFPGIIISEEQSKTLGLSLGNTVDVISPKTTMSPTGPVPRILRFRVAGIYSTKHFKYDLKFAFTSLETIQKFSKKKDTVSGFEIRLDNKVKIDDFANQVKNKFSPDFKIDTWKTKNRALFNAMKLEKIVMFIILVVMILVAAFSITANLIMVVIDKKQEISIIKSMGSNNFSIKKIFVMQGFFVGLIGLILGLTGGLSICIYLATIGIKTSENIFVSARIPVSVNTIDIILISLSAIILAVAATLYPSWKASSVSPVEGLNKIE